MSTAINIIQETVDLVYAPANHQPGSLYATTTPNQPQASGFQRHVCPEHPKRKTHWKQLLVTGVGSLSAFGAGYVAGRPESSSVVSRIGLDSCGSLATKRGFLDAVKTQSELVYVADRRYGEWRLGMDLLPHHQLATANACSERVYFAKTPEDRKNALRLCFQDLSEQSNAQTYKLRAFVIAASEAESHSRDILAPETKRFFYDLNQYCGNSSSSVLQGNHAISNKTAAPHTIQDSMQSHATKTALLEVSPNPTKTIVVHTSLSPMQFNATEIKL